MVFTLGREVNFGLGRGFAVGAGFGNHGIQGFFNPDVATGRGVLVLLLPDCYLDQQSHRYRYPPRIAQQRHLIP
jgi:hypothetical protein